jgi:glucose uptake protein
VIGLLLASLLWAVTLGSLAEGGEAFASNLAQADRDHILYAIAGGMVFNAANLLLVAAIDIAGMAVAFPLGIGVALVIGVLVSYSQAPKGNPFLLFGGMALVVGAIVLSALAYRRREAVKGAFTPRGIWISLACGLLMGSFYPFVNEALSGERSLGPYSVAFVFAIGVALCALPLNYLMMRNPLTDSAPLSMTGYRQARPSWHLIGLLGGMIWMTGTVFNFVASSAQIVGPAISYAIGQGATMVSVIWGVFVWKEFRGAPKDATRLLLPMFLLFAAGLGAIACAPLFGGQG